LERHQSLEVGNVTHYTIGHCKTKGYHNELLLIQVQYILQQKGNNYYYYTKNKYSLCKGFECYRLEFVSVHCLCVMQYIRYFVILIEFQNPEMEELPEKGYVLLRNTLTPQQIEIARNCFQERKLHYHDMANFIEQHMLPQVNKQLAWQSIYVKFRASDNNNSTDASTFHRDLITHDTQPLDSPCYTCLAYLDPTVMELIPGSHKFNTLNLSQAAELYKFKQQVNIKPGDLLVFASTLLHRGIFTEKLPHRRLLQVFETYPNKEIYHKYAQQVQHIPASNPKASHDMAKLMKLISKSKILVGITNVFGYLNASEGYGTELSPLQKLQLSQFKYVSSEAKQPRITDWLDTSEDKDFGAGERYSPYQNNNMYAVMQPTYDLQDQDMKDELYNIQYTNSFLKYALLFIILCIVIYLLCKYSKNYNQSKS